MGICFQYSHDFTVLWCILYIERGSLCVCASCHGAIFSHTCATNEYGKRNKRQSPLPHLQSGVYFTTTTTRLHTICRELKLRLESLNLEIRFFCQKTVPSTLLLRTALILHYQLFVIPRFLWRRTISFDRITCKLSRCTAQKPSIFTKPHTFTDANWSQILFQRFTSLFVCFSSVIGVFL